MIVKFCLILLIALTFTFGLMGSTGAQSKIESVAATVVYLGQKGDPYYEPDLAYTGLSLRDLDRPVIGAEIAIRSARVLSRSLGLKFSLDVVLIDPGDSALDAVADAFVSEAVAVLLDLPEPIFEELVASKSESSLLINIRHRDDRWRGVGCASNLLHTIPSYSMRADAMAQYLRVKGWDRVLLLRGKTLEDVAEAEAVRRAIAKFGLRLADDREFELTNDPRKRDESNLPLLTGGVRHDVVWLVDNDGEFGRYVPYDTYDPRPIIGTEGLIASAWHWTYECHGAPQLNQRFRRASETRMQPEDWAAWVAVRSIIEAVTRVGSADPNLVRNYIQSDALSVNLYKGVAGGFRPWDGQLRQPILLSTHNAVIAEAPFTQFQHQTNSLDTLGPDAAETACKR
ncbi:MAG: branched-chain amino acid ABC transporter substrate-binding protein [Roseobacter sp.]